MRSWVLGLALVLASAGGCARLVDYDEVCGDNSDCPADFLCREDGTCGRPCVSDGDCPADLPSCRDGYCATAADPECNTVADCGAQADACVGGLCTCADGPGCSPEQTCFATGCGCPPGTRGCGERCLPAEACCDNLACEGALCTEGACDCPGGQTSCRSDCVTFARCCNDTLPCVQGQSCVSGACCATNPAATESSCADRVDNDCDQLIDCLDVADCPAGTTCAANGAECRGGVCGGCPGQEDLDADGVCDGDDCDDSVATGATCGSGCASFCRDADGDGFGDPADSVTACVAPTGYVDDCADCADIALADPGCGGGAGALCNPNAADLCDGIDNDCDAASVDGADEAGFADACDGDDTDLCADDTLGCDGPTLACDPSDLGDDTLESCTDGLDNDCDGDTDCDDADCEGLACEDGLFCTTGDVCTAGACVPGVVDPCAARIGDADTDCSESCDESADDCVANDPPASACDDGAHCTGLDSCDAGGTCVSAGDPCGSEADANCVACNEDADDCSGVEPNGAACDDGTFCNGADSCQGGACLTHLGDPCLANVGDADADCSESCDENANDCVAVDPPSSACSDGLHCNGTDTCNAGACSVHTGNPCAARVGDGDDDCSEACDEAVDDCVGNEPNGTACNDGLFCNGADTCSSGACSVHPTPACGVNDANCVGGCDEANDSCTLPLEAAGSPCEDGAYCTAGDACNGSGTCVSGAGTPCGGTTCCFEDDDSCCACNYGQNVLCILSTQVVPALYGGCPGWCVTAGCFGTAQGTSGGQPFTYYNFGTPYTTFAGANCQADPGQTIGNLGQCTTPTTGCQADTAQWSVTCGSMTVDGSYSCNGINCQPIPYRCDGPYCQDNCVPL